MWEVWHGVRAYSNITTEMPVVKIVNGKIRPSTPFECRAAKSQPVSSTLSKQWQSLASRCWANDPLARPSAVVASEDVISYSL
eukprot:m.257031 g.257031  ORF g.257031 m.257031 type:complete len:83 (+) comp40405_c1_seq1:2-250(+)